MGTSRARRLAPLRGENLNMALRRFHIDKEMLHENRVAIRGDLFHHIREVCRFDIGDEFEVLTGDGQAHKVKIDTLNNKELAASVIGTRVLPALPKPHLTLCLSIPKLPKVDWIVEKCVELGVFEIRPFVSEYSFLRKVSEISENRLARWQKLVSAATQQSGRGDVMQIHPATSLEKLLAEFNRTSGLGGLFPYEGESQTGLSDALAQLKTRNLDQLWVFVGSEGGFSLNEVEMFAKSGMNPVTMGEQILRVETACLALASIIKYEHGR